MKNLSAIAVALTLLGSSAALAQYNSGPPALTIDTRIAATKTAT